MDSKILLAVCSIICLTILGSIVAFTQPESRALDAIIAAISAGGGISIYLIGQNIKNKVRNKK